MNQLKRRMRMAAAGVITSTLIACTADRIVAPTSTAAMHVPASEADIRRELMGEVASLKTTLAANNFYQDLDPRTDGVAILERRGFMQRFQLDLEKQIVSRPKAPPVPLDGTRGDEEAPTCFQNGTLDGCFISVSHSIGINGSGNVFQFTSVFGQQSAVVSYTDNGNLGSPISVSTSISSNGMSQNFSYPAPNCNTTSHKIVSKATHQLSMSLIAIGGVSGSKISAGATACSYQGLTVTLSPATIGINSASTITVGGATQCTVVSVASSNTSVATIVDYTNNHFAANDAGPGTTTISASCGTQTGSAILTVAYPVLPPTDLYVPNTGGGGECADGTEVDWYRDYHTGYGWQWVARLCVKN